MAVESRDDRLALLADWGETVNLNGTDVVAIFDDAHTEVDLVGAAISTVVPMLQLEDTEAGLVNQGDPVTVRGRPYTVMDIRPDGTGMTDLVLQAD